MQTFSVGLITAVCNIVKQCHLTTDKIQRSVYLSKCYQNSSIRPPRYSNHLNSPRGGPIGGVLIHCIPRQKFKIPLFLVERLGEQYVFMAAARKTIYIENQYTD